MKQDIISQPQDVAHAGEFRLASRKLPAEVVLVSSLHEAFDALRNLKTAAALWQRSSAEWDEVLSDLRQYLPLKDYSRSTFNDRRSVFNSTPSASSLLPVELMAKAPGSAAVLFHDLLAIARANFSVTGAKKGTGAFSNAWRGGNQPHVDGAGITVSVAFSDSGPLFFDEKDVVGDRITRILKIKEGAIPYAVPINCVVVHKGLKDLDPENRSLENLGLVHLRPSMESILSMITRRFVYHHSCLITPESHGKFFKSR